jgi:hypothetical protein
LGQTDWGLRMGGEKSWEILRNLVKILRLEVGDSIDYLLLMIAYFWAKNRLPYT